VKLSSFEALSIALESAGVRYLVAGGLAVVARGYARFTKDVDIVVQLVPENIEQPLPPSPAWAIAQPFRLPPLSSRTLRFVKAGFATRVCRF
jgi:hypothetical protein